MQDKFKAEDLKNKLLFSKDTIEAVVHGHTFCKASNFAAWNKQLVEKAAEEVCHDASSSEKKRESDRRETVAFVFETVTLYDNRKTKPHSRHTAGRKVHQRHATEQMIH